MDAINNRYEVFWNFLSQNQKDLLLEGDYLIDEVMKHSSYAFKDYSFIIFPYAKAYEGYLKTLFKDVGLISHLSYISDHLRLGKLLSPFMASRLGEKSLYMKIVNKSGKELANQIWNTWKIGRNQVFHYFPHNFKAVTFDEAQQIIKSIIQAMEAAYQNLNPHKNYTEIFPSRILTVHK